MTVRPRLRVIAFLGLVAFVTGCSVVPLPKTMAGRGQTPRDQEWDVKDCQTEMGYQTGYSPKDSPLANWFQRMFFWATTGAAVGGTVMLFPAAAGASVFSPTVTSPASEAVIAGAGAGGITGTALSWSGQKRFERAWVACMESRGYTIAPRGETTSSHGAVR